MGHTTVTEWNENYPSVGEVAGGSAAEIKYLRGAVRTRLLKEHLTPASDGVGGEHLRGSAVSFIGEYTGTGKAFPTTRPVQHVDGTDYEDEDDTGVVFTEADLGRLAYDTVGQDFYVLTAITPTWTRVIKAKQQSQATGTTDISNVTADWADIADMSITITPTSGILLFMFTAAIKGTKVGIRLIDDTSGAESVLWKSDEVDVSSEMLFNFQFLLTTITAVEKIYRVQWKDVSGTNYQYGTKNTRVFTILEQ